MIQRWSRYIWGLAVILVCVWSLPVQSYADDLEQIVYEGPVFGENEDENYPEEILEQNGKRYRRISVETRPAEKKGTLTYVSATVPCQLEGNQMPPEQASITLVFDVTGEEYQREVSMQEIREKSIFWEDDFSFPVTVYGYGAEVFYLGEYEIPAGTDLVSYSSCFLEYLELPQDCYRIERVEWSGECYEDEGIICRDAIAYGEKLIRDVDVVYGGQVRTPNIPAKQYVAVYEEMIETEAYEETVSLSGNETEEIEEIEETGSGTICGLPPKETFADKGLRWIKEHITVVVFSSLFLVCFGGWLVLLWMSGKKDTTEN